MLEWVLIVNLLTPGGDFIDKVPMYYPDRRSCNAALKMIKKPTDIDHPLGLKYQGWICVTKDHWEGKKPMKGVALD